MHWLVRPGEPGFGTRICERVDCILTRFCVSRVICRMGKHQR